MCLAGVYLSVEVIIGYIEYFLKFVISKKVRRAKWVNKKLIGIITTCVSKTAHIKNRVSEFIDIYFNKKRINAKTKTRSNYIYSSKGTYSESVGTWRKAN